MKVELTDGNIARIIKALEFGGATLDDQDLIEKLHKAMIAEVISSIPHGQLSAAKAAITAQVQRIKLEEAETIAKGSIEASIVYLFEHGYGADEVKATIDDADTDDEDQ